MHKHALGLDLTRLPGFCNCTPIIFAVESQRMLPECLALSTHEEGRVPWSASQLSALPHAEGMTFHPFKVSDRPPPFSQAASHAANLFTLKTFRFTFKQHRISAILDIARGNNLKTFAAHSLSEQLRTVVVMEDCVKPIHSSSLDSFGLSKA